MPHTIKYMSVEANISDKAEVLSAIKSASEVSQVRIATINPEFMLEAERNPAFRKALSFMSHSIVDGSGLFFMLKLWNRKLKISTLELYHGSDLMADLFLLYKDGSKTFYFLGGVPGNAEKAKVEIEKKYPGIRIVGTNDGGTIDPNNPVANRQVMEEITETRPDIVTVGFGAPRQELWIMAASQELNVPVMVGVGGTLDFYTKKKRAPKWLRVLHLEWLGRVFTEKGHWKRAFRAVVLFPLKAGFWMLGTLGKSS